MGYLFGSGAAAWPVDQGYFGNFAPYPRQRGTGGPPSVNSDTARRHSAVWASVRLRANLVSSLPLDTYRKILGRQVEVFTPPVLVNPGGERFPLARWLYESQQELDTSGNFIGIIREVDGSGKPSLIETQSSSACSIVARGSEIVKYKIYGEEYDPDKIWHEVQYPLAGSPVGMSPVAYAAWTLGEFQSVQEFIYSWFSGGATPRARLKNIEREVDQDEAALVKEAWRAAVAADEPFVHGRDWEYNLMQAAQASADWLEALKQTTTDIARFFDVPSDLIDAAVSGQSVTYANITQRNLQFLIMHLGPMIKRREDALSNLLAKPRYVKLNSDALLRMDPVTRAEHFRKMIESRQLTPSEAREIEDRPPFTPDQIAEFDHFWPPKQPKEPPQGL